jgi:hypothetical protein
MTGACVICKQMIVGPPPGPLVIISGAIDQTDDYGAMMNEMVAHLLTRHPEAHMGGLDQLMRMYFRCLASKLIVCSDPAFKEHSDNARSASWLTLTDAVQFIPNPGPVRPGHNNR